MSNDLTLTGLIISIWVDCVAGALKEEWGGGVGSKKEKKEGGKKRRGDPFFSFLHSTPSTPLAPATQASVLAIL